MSGPNVFAGYWRMPEKTREEFTHDGFFKTGDVGKIDGLGYVTIVGRSKDLIISGGYNVYPREVEDALMSHPGVSACAVIGLPDERWVEAVTAVVVLRERLGWPHLAAIAALVAGALHGIENELALEEAREECVERSPLAVRRAEAADAHEHVASVRFHEGRELLRRESRHGPKSSASWIG